MFAGTYMSAMWIARIRLRHECIIGNRCRQFGVMIQSLDLGEEKKGDTIRTSSIHQLVGTDADIKTFYKDLLKDERTIHAELSGKTLFLIESAKDKPVSQFSKMIFFIKPAITDKEGYEHYEIASHKKEELMRFINKVKPIVEEFVLESIKKTALKNVYFPKMMPGLTDLQKQALELAIGEGYYAVPKQTSLRALAKLSGVSLATYQKHLQKAESKIMPDLLAQLK